MVHLPPPLRKVLLGALSIDDVVRVLPQFEELHVPFRTSAIDGAAARQGLAYADFMES